MTALLSISQRDFFLEKFPPFLSICVIQLKNRDLQLAALDSIYRLLWVYFIRVQSDVSDSNTNVEARVRTVVEAALPHNSRSVTPKDAPLNHFVRIIHVVSQVRVCKTDDVVDVGCLLLLMMMVVMFVYCCFCFQ